MTRSDGRGRSAVTIQVGVSLSIHFDKPTVLLCLCNSITFNKIADGCGGGRTHICFQLQSLTWYLDQVVYKLRFGTDVPDFRSTDGLILTAVLAIYSYLTDYPFRAYKRSREEL
jgi:hypothetical protein